MAKVKLNPLIEGISGRMGDLVFRLSSSGKTYVTRRPDMSNVKWSKAQQANRRRFQRADAYAKAALADAELRALYEERAANEDRHPYRVAHCDYLKGMDLLAERKPATEK